MAAIESDPLLPQHPTNSLTAHPGRHHQQPHVWRAVIIRLIDFLLVVGAFLLGGLYFSRHDMTSLSNSLPDQGTTTTTEKMPTDVLSDSSEETFRFRATQLISFTINTMGGLQSYGECVGRDVDTDGTCYLGNAQNISEDLFHRIDIIKHVLRRLKRDRFEENPEVDTRKDVLKIVLMPEFLIRGPFGAYSTSQLFGTNVLFDAADEIREIIRSDSYDDFFFVFGTMIAASSSQESLSPWQASKDPNIEVTYYNFAPVARGGSNHSDFYLVLKKYISLADFLDRVALPNPTAHDMREYGHFPRKYQDLFTARGSKIIENNIVELDGLRIGIEICLDHRHGVLWRNIQSSRNPKLVDIQLIVSAGMAINLGPNPVVPGGVVYLSDGEASSAACRRSDEGRFDPDFVCREDIAAPKHIPVGGVGYSDFFTLEACIDLENVTLFDGYYSLYQTQGCAYTLKLFGVDVMDELKFYPPSLEIYPTVDIPGRNNAMR